jgi:ABC-type sulfate transport system permease subunit
VFRHAFADGFGAFLGAFADPTVRHALRLS